MQKNIAIAALSLLSIACTTQPPVDNSTPKKEHIGSWQLVSKTTTIRDSVTYSNLEGQKTIKILNEDHFAFFTHEVKTNPQDTTEKVAPQFVSGAGSFTLNGRVYAEYLEYCNYREWENNKFEFDLEVKGDSLIQSGVEEIKELKINQTIVEKYIRIKE